MQVQKKINGSTIVRAEGDTHVDLFEALSSMQEVFADDVCGCCDGDSVRFVVRQNKDDDKFYELHCLSSKCRARLSFGASKKGGGLYPKRKFDTLSKGEKENRKHQEKDVNEWGYLPNNGWYKYTKSP